MKYFRNILLTEKLNKERVEKLFEKSMSKFYIGYLITTLSNKDNEILMSNIELLKQYY